MDATLSATNDRPVLRLERRLAHPVEKVWRAVTERRHLDHWFPGPFEGELVPGGTLRFASPGHGMPPMEGRVLEVDPPTLLSFTWAGDVLRWELVPDAEGALLVLEHTFCERPDAASFAAGWETCFDALATVVAGDPQPAPMERWARRHEHWVAALRLDAGWAEKVGDRTYVRFARPLTAPEPDVKPVLDELARPGIAGAGAAEVCLVPGPGDNARLVVAHPLPPGADVDEAVAAWRTYVAEVAARLPGGQIPI